MQTLYHDAMALAVAEKEKWEWKMGLDSTDEDWQIAAKNFAATNATINALQPFVNRESFDNDKRKGQ